MTKPIVIGVTGLKGSGKDEVAKALDNAFLGVKHICMSDPIYTEVAQFLWDDSVADIKREKEFYRPLLQWWGIYRRKKRGSDYWVNKMLDRVKRVKKRADIVVVSSVRMWEEVTAIREQLGGTIWRVVRPGVHSDDHVTETQLLQFREDVGIHNDADLPRFHMRVVKAMLDTYPHSADLLRTKVCTRKA